MQLLLGAGYWMSAVGKNEAALCRYMAVSFNIGTVCQAAGKSSSSEGRARHSVRAGMHCSLVTERRAEDCPPYLPRCVNLNVNCYSVADVELFLPTKKLLQLDVDDPKYILRKPLVFTNLASLFPGTGRVTGFTNFPPSAPLHGGPGPDKGR